MVFQRFLMEILILQCPDVATPLHGTHSRGPSPEQQNLEKTNVFQGFRESEPSWHHLDSSMAQDSPKMSQHSPKMAPTWPNLAQHDPNLAATWLQLGFNMANLAQLGSNLAPT